MGKGSPTPDNQLSEEELKALYTPDKYVWTLSDELKKIAKKELREDEKTRDQALAQMRDWIAKTSYIKDCRVGKYFKFKLRDKYTEIRITKISKGIWLIPIWIPDRCQLFASFPSSEEV